MWDFFGGLHYIRRSTFAFGKVLVPRGSVICAGNDALTDFVRYALCHLHGVRLDSEFVCSYQPSFLKIMQKAQTLDFFFACLHNPNQVFQQPAAWIRTFG